MDIVILYLGVVRAPSIFAFEYNAYIMHAYPLLFHMKYKTNTQERVRGNGFPLMLRLSRIFLEY